MTGEELAGKVAIVTGASRGIGKGLALGLAEAGVSVVVAARTEVDRPGGLPGSVRSTVEAVTAAGGTALGVCCDIAVADDLARLVDATMTEFGRLDVLVNNAGVMLLGPAVGAPIEEWERMVRLNVMGLLYTAHAALPHLLRAAEQGPRRVADLINISSVAGRRARVGTAVYNLTKFGVGAFSESIRQEVTKRHVRVSLIEPGLVNTELQTHMRDEIRDASMRAFADIEALAPQDIADAIEYVVTRPRHVAVNELLVRPTEQEN